jgi:hypothetical protein
MSAYPDWPALARALTHYHETCPDEALAAALAAPQWSTEPLLAELAACAADPAPRCDDEAGWMLHLYATLLLAAQRQTRAFEPLLAIARLPGETLEALLGDHLTESLPRALAATCPVGGEAALKALACDTQVYFWSRSAALRALALRALEGDYPRARLVDWLGQVAEAEANRMIDENLQPEPGTENDFLGELVVTMEEVGASEYAGAVGAWIEDGLIESEAIKPEDTLARLKRDWATCQAEELAHGWGYPRDVVAEIGRWACFQPDAEDDEAEETGPKPEPIRREAPKVGRNDPCPCGSGKKYKKCCGA